MDSTVFVAVRRIGRSTVVGYFATAEEILAKQGWAPCTQPKQSIAGVMAANHCSKEQALRLMNGHWQS